MMTILKAFGSLLLTVVICVVGASIFDICISALYLRFYTNAVFITIFGVAGVIAGFMAWGQEMVDQDNGKKMAPWILALMTIFVGLIFVFILSPLEGGEYGDAFKAFGIMLIVAGVITWFLKKQA